LIGNGRPALATKASARKHGAGRTGRHVVRVLPNAQCSRQADSRRVPLGHDQP